MFVPDGGHYHEGCLYQMGGTIVRDVCTRWGALSSWMFVPDTEHYCEGCLYQMGSTLVMDVCTRYGALL